MCAKCCCLLSDTDEERSSIEDDDHDIGAGDPLTEEAARQHVSWMQDMANAHMGMQQQHNIQDAWAHTP